MFTNRAITLISFQRRQITFGLENGYSLLPGALTRFPPRLVRCDAPRKTLSLNEPPENSSPANSRLCSITFLATHGRLHLSTCAVEAVTLSLFLQWHFDRLMLFACRVSLIVFFYQHWFLHPHGWLPQLLWGQGSKRKSTMSYQSEWCSCSRLIKRTTIRSKWKGNESKEKCRFTRLQSGYQNESFLLVL